MFYKLVLVVSCLFIPCCKRQGKEEKAETGAESESLRNTRTLSQVKASRTLTLEERLLEQFRQSDGEMTLEQFRREFEVDLENDAYGFFNLIFATNFNKEEVKTLVSHSLLSLSESNPKELADIYHRLPPAFQDENDLRNLFSLTIENEPWRIGEVAGWFKQEKNHSIVSAIESYLVNAINFNERDKPKTMGLPLNCSLCQEGFGEFVRGHAIINGDNILEWVSFALTANSSRVEEAVFYKFGEYDREGALVFARGSSGREDGIGVKQETAIILGVGARNAEEALNYVTTRPAIASATVPIILGQWLSKDSIEAGSWLKKELEAQVDRDFAEVAVTSLIDWLTEKGQMEEAEEWKEFLSAN